MHGMHHAFQKFTTTVLPARVGGDRVAVEVDEVERRRRLARGAGSFDVGDCGSLPTFSASTTPSTTTTPATAQRDPPRRVLHAGTSSSGSTSSDGPSTGATSGSGSPSGTSRSPGAGRVGRRSRGASARTVPSAMTPPPIQSHTIIGFTRTPSVMRPPPVGDDTSVR